MNRTETRQIGDYRLDLNPRMLSIPPHIELTQKDGREGIVIWTKSDALALAHHLMSLAHALAYMVEEER